MKASTELPAMALSGNPAALMTEALKFKIFSPQGTPPLELYLDIDVPKKSVRFSEKDRDYRLAVIACLSRGNVDTTSDHGGLDEDSRLSP
jgi:hypothetical protein